jgi:glucosylglycerate synthase
MAKVELSEETKAVTEEVKEADLLIAVAAPVDATQLRDAVTQAVRDQPAFSGLRTVIAFPGSAGAETTTEAEAETAGQLRFLPYAYSPGDPSRIPGLPSTTTYQSMFATARGLGVKACAVIGPDLAALAGNSLSALVGPVVESRCELAMPLYPLGKYDQLLNSSILAPLTRALYGKRVRFPLAPDFCISGALLPQLEQGIQRSIVQGQTLFWPATEALLREASICQVRVDTRHLPSAEGVDLSTVLAQTVGPLFAEMMTNASLWQRVRGTQAVETTGTASPALTDSAPTNTAPMIETFQLGYRNLQEVWSLVLPPVTILELKRLARPGTDRFHMPDDLWVRLIYDFALAYRLRTIGRTHLLGALTPLYLGWVASYALEVANAGAPETEQRLEKLARAYEEGKPYLLQRWRWPDRFNP